MPKSSKELKHDWIKIALLGPSGSGKTNFLGTVCDNFKTYILSTERGLKTIDDKDFDYDDIENWEQYVTHLNWFVKNYKNEGYQAICVDSFSRAAYLLSKYLEDKKGADGKLDFDDHRRILNTLNRQLLLLTTKLDCHVIITSIAGEDRDESAGMMKLSARISGQTRDMLPEYFDVVAVAKCDVDKNGNTKYWHQIEGDKATPAKSRLNHLRGKRNVAPDIKIYLTKGE